MKTFLSLAIVLSAISSFACKGGGELSLTIDGKAAATLNKVDKSISMEPGVSLTYIGTCGSPVIPNDNLGEQVDITGEIESGDSICLGLKTSDDAVIAFVLTHAQLTSIARSVRCGGEVKGEKVTALPPTVPVKTGSKVIVQETGKQTFKYVKVQAKKVKAVEVTLKTEITRKDCNQQSLNATAVKVSGNEANWYAKFFVSSFVSFTEMYCPIEVAVKETIKSAPIVFKSFTNENIDGEVDITLMVPENITVVAKEIK